MGKVNKFDQNINSPVIAGVEITTDAEGRFNLNALHKASGGKDKDKPALWLRLDSTKALIAELGAQSTDLYPLPVETITGRKGGTFAAEELAVSYAGWISAAFQLEVNRTFIAVRRGDVQVAPVAQDKLSREARLQFRQSHWIAKELGLAGAQAVFSANRVTKALTGVDMMGLLGVTHVDAPTERRDINPTEIGNRLGGYKASAVNKMLCNLGYQEQFRDYKGRPYYEMTVKGREAGGRMKDTGKKHDSGTPVMQLQWSSEIVDRLRADLKGGVA